MKTRQLIVYYMFEIFGGAWMRLIARSFIIAAIANAVCEIVLYFW